MQRRQSVRRQTVLSSVTNGRGLLQSGKLVALTNGVVAIRGHFRVVTGSPSNWVTRRNDLARMKVELDG